MRKSSWSPSIIPKEDDQNVYLVLDDFGRNGRAYPETDVERTDLEAVIMGLIEGQYNNPVRVVGFNTAEAAADGAEGAAEEACRQNRDPIQ